MSKDCEILRAALPAVYGLDERCCADGVGISCSSDSSRVTKLSLTGLKLGGSLPSQISQLTGLTSLNLSHNAFTGLVPESWAALDKLVSIDLSNNLLSGNVPSWSASVSKQNLERNCFNDRANPNPDCALLNSASILPTLSQTTAAPPTLTTSALQSSSAADTPSSTISNLAVPITVGLCVSVVVLGAIIAVLIICRRSKRNKEEIQRRSAFQAADRHFQDAEFSVSAHPVKPSPENSLSESGMNSPVEYGLPLFQTEDRTAEEDRRRNEWLQKRMIV
ncbi:hypothetical protein BJ741DRAFT_620025 [Chytriomyces cf. hyalinus JEL632]|nr:hypothetical protein BJ741DRAFT_620025 [Chytriomyces cf. hyalinus JEL632]